MKRICIYWLVAMVYLTPAPTLAEGITADELVNIIVAATESPQERTIRKLRDEIAAIKNPVATQSKTKVRSAPKPVYYSQEWTSGHWTWPGDLRQHLIQVHGVEASSVNAASAEQLQEWHDYTHTHSNWKAISRREAKDRSRKKPVRQGGRSQRVSSSRRLSSSTYCPS